MINVDADVLQCSSRLCANCRVIILQLFWEEEGRSLEQIPGEETHQRLAPAASSSSKSGPREKRGI